MNGSGSIVVGLLWVVLMKLVKIEVVCEAMNL